MNGKIVIKIVFSSLIKAIITNKVVLAVPDYRNSLCLSKDASSTQWAGVLTQVNPSKFQLDLKFPIVGPRVYYIRFRSI